MSSSPGWISCTSPIIRASSADTFRAASAIHFAQWVPTRRVSRLTPPLPGIAPSLRVSGSPQCVSGVQNRKSQETAISVPAPRHGPFAATMIGFSMLSISS